MNVNLFLLIAFCIAILFILFLVTKLRRVRGQLSIIEEALEDIKSGNLNRRMLAKKNDMTRKLNPLRKADDAVEVDTTKMNIEEVKDTVIKIIKEKVGI